MMVRVHALLSLFAVLSVYLFTCPVRASEEPTPPPLCVDSPDVDDPVVDYSRKQDEPHREATRRTRYRATFFNTHTHELLPAPLEQTINDAELASFLRCRVTGDHIEMAPRVVEVALDTASHFESEQIQIISGFRSPKFNELLRKKGRQVSRTSHHTHGEALDFRIPGVPAAELAAQVEAIHQGGIGTYRHSNFVHVDVGRDRRWRGR